MKPKRQNDTPATLTGRLRAAIAGSGLTDTEIARAARVPRSLVSRFREGAQSSLYLEIAEKLAIAIEGRLTLTVSAPSIAKATSRKPEVCKASYGAVRTRESIDRNGNSFERRLCCATALETTRAGAVHYRIERKRKSSAKEIEYRQGAQIAALTKAELIANLSRGGVRHKLTAERIAGSHELHKLADDAVIDGLLLQGWIGESPHTSDDQWYSGKHAPLSDSDLRFIDECLRQKTKR